MEKKQPIQSQPITTYSNVENHLGTFVQNTFNNIPAIANPHTHIKSVQPHFPLRGIKHTGVYVPAISTNIIIWSIRLNKAVPFSDIFKV